MAIAEQEVAERFSVRLDREQQEKLAQAAQATGQSLDDFAAAALLRAADAALASPSVTVLSNRDFDYLMTLCASDAPPAPALVRAAEEYKRRLADGSLQVED